MNEVTLGEMLSLTKMYGDVEIANECNETLLVLQYVEYNVCPLSKTLSKELLERKVLNFGTVDGRALFKVEGVEDAA